MTISEAAQVFASPQAYANDEYFHRACDLLRAEQPVVWVEAEGVYPFWAITKHADVLEIEARPGTFTNAPRPVLVPKEDDDAAAQNGNPLRTLIYMDDPDHRAYRAITAEWFLPKSMARLDGRLAELAKASVAKMKSLGGTCDFARDITMQYPLQVILAILGLPDSDYDRMLTLTQELFGQQDPEFSRGTTQEDRNAVLMDFFAYFTALTEDRRAHPTEDLASVIANARINGELLPILEVMSYYTIIATAGHDTTSSSIAGGMLELIKNPDQLARLQNDPSLMASAVDEMIRHTSPVKHFIRTAQEDYSIRGVHIRKGDSVLLSYSSANRDEDVFPDPHKFDVGRTPNKQIAFGFGVHFCLGAMLARMELKALFSVVVPRIGSIALNGTPELTQSTFVSGLKRLPVTYTLRP